MLGCSSPPVTSASSRKRARLSGRSAWTSLISFNATSRLSFFVAGYGDFAQRALGVRTEDAEARSGGSRGADGKIPRLLAGRFAADGGDSVERRLHAGIGHRAELARGVAERADRGQALLRVVIVLANMGVDQRREQVAIRPRERILGNEYLAQRFGLLQHPGVHGRDQGVAADEVHLQGENAEEQIAIVFGRSRFSRGRVETTAALRTGNFG